MKRLLIGFVACSMVVFVGCQSNTSSTSKTTKKDSAGVTTKEEKKDGAETKKEEKKDGTDVKKEEKKEEKKD